MITLLVIQSWGGALEQVRRQWPYYTLPGWDICGCCPEDSFHTWPAEIRYCELIGKSAYFPNPQLVKTWVKTWETLLLRDCYKKYESFCMIEYDSVFLRQPPPHPGGLFSHLAGGPMQGFKASRFFHCPWFADRATAAIIVEEGNKLISEGEFEHGSPDVFLGLITDRRPEIKVTETGTFSTNGGGWPDHKDAIAKAVKNGCWFAHGLRTQQELDWVLSQRP